MDRFVRDEDIVTRQIAGETLLIPIRAQVADLESIYVLNEVGTLIWQHLDGSRSEGEIVAAICREYDSSGEAAARDVREFLATLETAGVIRRIDRTDA